ncbi:MAG: polysaccharide deacetylase family protein, partial [Pseudomonadota bacterium]
LTLHRVRPNRDDSFDPNAHLSVEEGFLASIVHMLQRRGIEFISMDDVAERVKAGRSGSRFCSVTFDDGYCDTARSAAPILFRNGVPFTVYVASGLVEGTADLWWELVEEIVRRNDSIAIPVKNGATLLECETSAEKDVAIRSIIDFLTKELDENEQREWVRNLCSLYRIDADTLQSGQIMDWSAINRLAENPLCTIGSHTVSHRALGRISAKDVEREIRTGVDTIEAATGKRPKHFAYPYGYRAAASQREFDIARECGVTTAVTTRPGMLFSEHADHMTALPRISVNGLYQTARHFAPLTSGLPTRLKTRFRRLDVA